MRSLSTTDRILAQIETDVTQYPGMPPDPRTKSMTILTDGLPSMETFEDLHHEYGATHLNVLFTIDEARKFREFLPYTHNRIAPLDEATLESCTLQLMTELQGKVSTIDAAIVNSDRRSKGGVMSKVYQYCRLSRIANGHGAGRDGIPFDETAEPLAPFTKERYVDILIAVKKRMIDLFEHTPFGLTPVEEVENHATLDSHERRKYAYLSWLQQRLGDNLVFVKAYGSYAKTDDLSRSKDCDNWIGVHDLDAAYAALRDTNPHFNPRTGEVANIPTEEEQKLAEVMGFKHLGLLIFPAKGAFTGLYQRSLDDALEFLNAKLVYGRLVTPLPGEDERYDRAIFNVFLKDKSVAGSMTNWFDNPQPLVHRVPLYEFNSKLPLFGAKNHLYLSTGVTPTKEEQIAFLQREYGTSIVPHSPGVDLFPEAHGQHLIRGIHHSRILMGALIRDFFQDIHMRGGYFSDS